MGQRDSEEAQLPAPGGDGGGVSCTLALSSASCAAVFSFLLSESSIGKSNSYFLRSKKQLGRCEVIWVSKVSRVSSMLRVVRVVWMLSRTWVGHYGPERR